MSTLKRIDKEFIYCEIENKVATVYFNRPPLNLFTYQVFREIGDMFTELEAYVGSDDVRAVILTSAVEKAFSAGDDVKGGPSTSDEAVYENQLAKDSFDKVRNFSAPVISAVDGYAYGGGMVLAMMADYIICGERARFGFTEINFGMFANWGTTLVLGKNYSLPHVKHIMISGERFGAEEALEMNFVQKVVPSEKLQEEAHALAALYASKAPIAVRAIKALLNNAKGLDAQAHFSLENYLTRITFDSEDVAEGTQAFAEKREPVFKNR